MQQASFRLFLDLTGNKSFYLYNGTEIYYKQLRSAFRDIKNDLKKDYLNFSFFTLCAATLEYSLNYMLTDYSVEKFGPEDYKPHLARYTGLGFRYKLLKVPYIISNGKLRLNETHSSFKRLEELILLRNRILHNKESLNEFELAINGQLHNDGVFI